VTVDRGLRHCDLNDLW